MDRVDERMEEQEEEEKMKGLKISCVFTREENYLPNGNLVKVLVEAMLEKGKNVILIGV